MSEAEDFVRRAVPIECDKCHKDCPTVFTKEQAYWAFCQPNTLILFLCSDCRKKSGTVADPTE